MGSSVKNKRDRLFFTLLFVPQAPQSSYDRRAELEVLLAIPSAQSACGMEITMTDRHPYYEFEKDTYEIDEFDCSSIFLFVGKERALLLDTGCGIGDLKGVIRKITDKPYIVIASHGHMDHIGGAGAFDELYINPADNYFLDVSFEKCWKAGEIMQILSGSGRINIILTAQRKICFVGRKNRSCFRYPTVRHSILEGVSLRHIAVPDIPPAK